MGWLDQLTNDNLIIIPNTLKKGFLTDLNKLSKLFNVKLLSLEELRKYIYFDYDIDAILYLMDKYNYCYEVSKILIDNMYYVEDKKYDYHKLNKLVSLKNELINENLININHDFLSYLKNKTVFIYSYKYLSEFDLKTLNALGNYKIIDSKEIDYECKKVYQFNSIKEEVNFVFSEIAQLIKKGININDIKLLNINDKYNNTLKRLAKLYKIPIEIKDKSSILTNELVKEFLTILKNNQSLEYSLDIFGEKFVTDEDSRNIYQNLINISNKYIGKKYSFNSIYNAVVYDLKKVYLKQYILKNKLEIVEYENIIINDNKYYFYLSFNQGDSPKIYKDEDYFSDEIKKTLGLLTSIEKNKTAKYIIKDLFSKTKNIFISYKLKDNEGECYRSSLLDELDMEIVTDIPNSNICYSKDYEKLYYASLLDDFITYGTKPKELNYYYSNLDIPYLNYDNSFTKVDRNKVLEKINNKLLLSYSTIDNYFRCSFRYYLTSILKLDEFESNFATLIGNLFHELLAKSLGGDFNFDIEWNMFLHDKRFTNKELFFLGNLKEELNLIINNVKDLHKETGLTESLLEHKVVINKDLEIPITFMGIIDKIMYKEFNDKLVVSLIDYKTGKPNTNLLNTAYGIDMQLPIYLYLIKNISDFKDSYIAGFYLQKIVSSKVNKVIDKTELEQKQHSLKLQGYSNSNTDILERFDPTYENSVFIRSLKITSKGFSPYSKIIDNDQIDKLVSFTEKKIDAAIKNILNGNFDINPKRIGLENEGCKFCKFRDICFVRESDIKNLEAIKDFSFLGGDNNA